MTETKFNSAKKKKKTDRYQVQKSVLTGWEQLKKVLGEEQYQAQIEVKYPYKFKKL